MRTHLIITAFGLMLFWLPTAAAQPADDSDASGQYRVTMLHAAPSKWVAMKALIEGQGEAGAADKNGRVASYRMRHSQGAPWDFMLIQPIASMSQYLSDEIQARQAKFRSAIGELADFEEDWFVTGPAHATLQQAYPAAGAFLIEMFRAHAGMKQALKDSRSKENRILAKIDTPTNFIFSGSIGADWDVMIIGFYRDFAHWGSAGNEHSAPAQEQTTHEVSYNSVSELAPGLRDLLTNHNDTLATTMD